MAVAEAGHGDAAEEVEVLLALGVPQARALAAHELDGEARVGAREARGPDLLEVREHDRDGLRSAAPCGLRSACPGGLCGSSRSGSDLRANAGVGEELQ